MTTIKLIRFSLFSVLLPLLFSWSGGLFAETMDRYRISEHGQGSVKYPPWFKDSVLDLGDDLDDAKEVGKRGIIVMFSQKNCAHCQAFIETTFNDPVISKRVRDTYDVIALDIFSDNEVTYIDGTETTIKNFAETSRARLTPTLIFFGVEKKPLLKIIGLYPPEKFSYVLDYIDGGHYKKIKLSQYIRQNKGSSSDDYSTLNYDFSIFNKPPHNLYKQSHTTATLVFFDRPNCSSCKRFHDRVLSNQAVRDKSKKFQSIQLDATDDTNNIVTPDGRKVSPKRWTDDLQLNYDYSLIFFDKKGKEVHRIDSETGKDRMLGSMQYVLEGAYERHEQFLQWRKEQALMKKRTSRK